ncbi:hypothetical protein [Pseudactinotalea suaedae]|uniref:hypothetical protein n=1 Tax=Pseudactinotalea suaedae TaxID=1524924 RepID=UPI0012E1EE2A|nr:hypothetical protein [Pseudactinotalea suaedae]
MADLVEAWWDAEVEDPAPGHRALMRLVATAVALEAVRPQVGSGTRLSTAVGLADRLAALQGPDGLFSSDGNLHSPPDSAFTLNDVGIALDLLPEVGAPQARELEARLRAVAAAAVPALVVGGVHTPNHRWEISSALVRLAPFDDRAVPRAREWLAEGVDVDADGIYSERSANYAAFVSNPCLLVLAEVLGRDDLEEIVHRNLHTILDLTDADGAVETVFSRRQDQGGSIPVEAFHTQLRRYAVRGCTTCAAGAARSEPRAGALAAIALLELAAEPELGADVEVAVAEARSQEPAVRHLAGVGLLVASHRRTRTVVYGGSDVPHVGRVGSGLAGNPTFLRYRSGDAVVRSLRLSRVFFGLGPFRAESLEVTDDGGAHLRETVTARYYQPLPAARRRSDGAYPLVDDGRFTASMAFDERPHDAVSLVTDVTVRTGGRGLEVSVETTGAHTRWSLEVALGEGDLTGVVATGPDTYRMTGSRAELRHGSDAVVIETTLDPEPEGAGFYAPGETFSFLGGTDALAGPRLYLTGTTPGAWTLRLRPA